MTTAIQNRTVLAWRSGRQGVCKNAELVFDGNEIVFVGERYEGAVDDVIDATRRLVIPGLINVHLHVTDTAFTKSLADTGSSANTAEAQNFVSLYKILAGVRHATDGDAQVVATECAFAELARTGSTTVVEIGYDFEVGGGDMGCVIVDAQTIVEASEMLTLDVTDAVRLLNEASERVWARLDL